VVPGLYQLSLGIVNAFLIQEDSSLTLIDTGAPGSLGRISRALASLGHELGDLDSIVLTHCHADHAGSVAALQQETGATTFMHAVDAALTQEGRAARSMSAAPGLWRNMVTRFLVRGMPQEIEPADIDEELDDGQILDVGSGLEVIHAPGHSAGHIALLWHKHDGVLIAADAAANLFGLGYAIVYEDLEEGRRSLVDLSMRSFETAVFGHGGPITRGAGERFRRRWAT
jgi:glyoxylase-like metal-dependent hydrolase (beta-lactamase superfamily II)